MSVDGVKAPARSADADLLLRAGQGDPRAFEELFDLHVDTVYRFALRRTRSVADAEDLTSTVFLTAWRRRGEFVNLRSSYVAWLLVITDHTSSNLARARRRNAALIARLATLRDLEPQPFSEEFHMLRSDVTVAIESLKGRDAEVLRLSLLAELTYEEIADVLGIPLGTVRSRLARAKGRLRALLASAELAVTQDSTRPVTEGR